MQRPLLHAGSFVGLLLIGWCVYALAQTRLQIDIEKGGAGLLPLAVPQLIGETAAPALGQQIRGVLRQDLELTGLFRIVDQATYPEVPQAVEQLQYPRWAASGVAG